MTVAYPRKFRNQLSAQAILNQVVRQWDIHMVTLNRYRFSEQRSCKDLTDLIERLDGQPRDLVRELSHHVADEARHAYWLTDLLCDLGEPVGKPPGISYIDEFERLLDYTAAESAEDMTINALAAINVTEKRGCEYFASHIRALKSAEPTAENRKICETIERIMPEEAAHVRWGNRWLAELSRKSPEHREKVEHAKRKYVAIEQAAFESGMDILAGAEFRRVNNLVKIAEELPLWKRPQYFMEHLPKAIFDPELQQTRIDLVQQAWTRDPVTFIEKFVPMFFGGNLGESPQKSAQN
ncbi:MAG: ferritin-like domain-containing protein [Oscillatoriales cyanobacterium SM2_2_1]|nr:ferritin-like domain-containing protein [Oscillatoriales cyanobacterium SM2_2_1]